MSLLLAGAHGHAWEIPAGALGRAGTGGLRRDEQVKELMPTIVRQFRK